MSALLLVAVLTATAMALLVAYSRHLFEENRTRVTRERHVELVWQRPEPRTTSDSELVWRTLVGAPSPARVKPSPGPLIPVVDQPGDHPVGHVGQELSAVAARGRCRSHRSRSRAP